jgi:putative cell wall-binding protein
MVTEEKELIVPRFYVVRRNLSQAEQESVLSYLAMTPVSMAIVSDVLDAELGVRLAGDVIVVASEKAARVLAAELAEELNRPVLVIGKSLTMIDPVFDV